MQFMNISIQEFSKSFIQSTDIYMLEVFKKVKNYTRKLENSSPGSITFKFYVK